MTKAGAKQKRKPKISDKKQSERFKEAARAIGADQESEAFDETAKRLARAKQSKSVKKE